MIFYSSKIEEAVKVFQSSSYPENLYSAVDKKAGGRVKHLLCYGLGSPSESYLSRHQLAALLALKERYKCNTLAYDPVFLPNDIQILKDHNIQVIEKNDEGKRKICNNGVTLVYFPHCSSQLVNNFIWANWNTSIHSCIVLSNSFSAVINRNSETTVASLACLRDIAKIVEESPVVDSYEIDSVFNDLSVHTFPTGNIVDLNFWQPRPEPNYEGETIEFCQKEVSVKLRPL